MKINKKIYKVNHLKGSYKIVLYFSKIRAKKRALVLVKKSCPNLNS